MRKLKTIAIIPARGGSKRIPRKNIKDFLGKPIIAYSIEAAIQSKLFDEVMVSTDDNEIAEIAKKYGASVPFMRSVENSDDYATLADVLEEVITEYRKKEQLFEYACCILPTSPLLREKKLKEGFDLLITDKFDSVRPIVQFSYPIQRSLKYENGKVTFFYPENQLKRSQDLLPTYHDAGQFYWFYSDKGLVSENRGAILVADMEVQDIDTIKDWKIAELKYEYFKQNNTHKK